jgi:hypothetical protein
MKTQEELMDWVKSLSQKEKAKMMFQIKKSENLNNEKLKMNASKTPKIIETAIKLSIILILIISATTKQPYSFYDFVRWSVMISSIYLVNRTYKINQTGLVIYFIATAILFNPFYKFEFQKEIWHLIDYVISGIIALTIIHDWTQNDKKT